MQSGRTCVAIVLLFQSCTDVGGGSHGNQTSGVWYWAGLTGALPEIMKQKQTHQTQQITTNQNKAKQLHNKQKKPNKTNLTSHPDPPASPLPPH